jgi:putative ABC transport system ATP-binding protein
MKESQHGVELQGVSRIYTKGAEGVVVFDDVDLEIKAGAFCALMGPSGSGKSTLLNLVGGLDRPDSGRVIVGGTSLSTLSESELAEWRGENVGFVFQGFNLVPVLTAFENVELPLLLTGLSKAERREHAMHALELVDMGDRAKHRPGQLSGGQEQRVAIARAIASDPGVILADEPTGDLDFESACQVLDLMGRLHTELGKTILMVTHDPRAAERAERIIHLDKGRIDESLVDAAGTDEPVSDDGFHEVKPKGSEKA